MTDLPPNHDPSSADQRSEIEELERIFALLTGVPTDRQQDMLEELCPDTNLRQQARMLLDADTSTDALFDHSLFPDQPKYCSGEQIGPYKLLQEIGQGGMGVVYMAEQLEPVRRKVALKVIKPGVDTRQVIARFDAERQALSVMNHPNIASVLDAGTTDSGRPYFVMELVKGQPITNYCDQNHLSFKQRLELFLPVCYAIRHAHQKGIIHRDIKPSNVLVAEYDGRPAAKVIDFGVAKATNQSLTDMTVFTGFGQIIGTFEYMSPEQSRVNQLDVDTRSDIYSLGVLLYELLTGGPPFGKERLRSVAWEEMLRIIREEDPPRPSSRISENTQPILDGKPRRKAPEKLGKLVRGELDWIVMKAMDKDRSRRYETPNDLANDIECFLNGDAVAACPPSATYLLRKFAKRNKASIATSMIVATSLIVGLIGMSILAIRARSAKAETQALNTFMKYDLLGLPDAQSQLLTGLSPEPQLKLNTLLNRAMARDIQSLSSDAKGTLASALSRIGRYKDATPLYEEYLQDLKTNRGTGDPETIWVMGQLVRVYMEQNRLTDAEYLCSEALDAGRQSPQLGTTHYLTLRLLNDLAILYQKQKRYTKAELTHNECLDLKIKSSPLGDRHPDALSIMSDLGLLYETRDDYEAAKENYSRVLEVHREISAPDHLRIHIADSLSNLGRCYLKCGRQSDDPTQYEDALPLLAEGLAIYRQTNGRDNHPDTLEVQSHLAQSYCELGRHGDAEPLLKSLVTRLKALRGAQHDTTIEMMNTLGWVYMHLDRLAEAEHILKNTLNRHRQLNRQDSTTVQAMGNLAIVYSRMGKLNKAISTDQKTRKLASRELGVDHPETISSIARLGLSHVEKGNIEQGHTLLKTAFNTAPNLPGASQIAQALADSYKKSGDQKNARLWQTKSKITTPTKSQPEA